MAKEYIRVGTHILFKSRDFIFRLVKNYAKMDKW